MKNAALWLRMSKKLSISKKFKYRFIAIAVLVVTGFFKFKGSGVKETELNDVKVREIKSKIAEIKNNLNQDLVYALTQEDLAFLNGILKNENIGNIGNEQQGSELGNESSKEININLAELQSWVKVK